jgi:hypothetical protein
LEFSDVLAARRRDCLSLRLTGVEISVRYSTAFSDARINDSAIIVGWIPVFSLERVIVEVVYVRTLL